MLNKTFATFVYVDGIWPQFFITFSVKLALLDKP